MDEYWVEIVTPETDDAHFEVIFDALVSEPNPAAVTGSKDRGGPSEYSFVIDAEDAPEAAMRAVATFRAAVAQSGGVGAANAQILQLHAAPPPAGARDDLEPRVSRLFSFSQLAARIRSRGPYTGPSSSAIIRDDRDRG